MLLRAVFANISFVSKAFLSILLVLAMGVMLVVIWVVRSPHGCTLPKSSAAKSDIYMYLSALQLYKINHGRYPSEQEGLQALREVGVTKIVGDPWGRPYRYVLNPSATDDVGIYSMGPDGKSATRGNDEDDINSWREEPVATKEEESVPIMVWLPWVLAGVGLSALIIIAGRAFGRRVRRGTEGEGEIHR